MTTAEREFTVVRMLTKVYSGGAYSSIVLSDMRDVADPRDRAFISRLFYGTLSRDTELEYIIGRLVKKAPRPAVKAVLKAGLYMLRHMDEPDHAAVDASVETVKRLGKRELAGFVNAVLRRSGEVKLPLGTGDRLLDASVNLSCPAWIVERLDRSYGEAFTDAFFSTELPTDTHVRHVPSRISREKFARLVEGSVDSGHGFYVPAATLSSLKEGLFAVQSEASVRTAEYYCRGIKTGAKVLDLCAAPGGKAVYVAQYTGAEVTACDIHPHRAELIRSYARRMGVELDVEVNDATVPRADFFGRFDAVLCDVPCSGIGVYRSKPDVLISRRPEDIASLAAVQKKILDVAADYVVPGGTLYYSTCTVMKEENDEAIDVFLSSHDNFAPTPLGTSERERDGRILLTPQDDGCDGFFVAAMRKTK